MARKEPARGRSRAPEAPAAGLTHPRLAGTRYNCTPSPHLRGATLSDRLFVSLQHVLPKQAMTTFAGAFAGAQGGAMTTRLIRWFVGRYGVNMAEAANPDIASYASFN